MSNNVTVSLDKAGTIRYFNHGVLHNGNLPAVVYLNNFRLYYEQGRLTRAIDETGRELDLKKKIHFPDGVDYHAVIGCEIYSKNGLHHHEHGPALNDSTGIKIWYIDGVETRREQSPNRTETNEDGTEDEYVNNIRIRRFNPDGSIDYYENDERVTTIESNGTVYAHKNGELIKSIQPDGTIREYENAIHVRTTTPAGIVYQLDTDGYMMKMNPTKNQTPIVPTFAVDYNDKWIEFDVYIGADRYSVRVSATCVEYHKNGKLHRDGDMPARKTATHWEFYTDGKLTDSHQTLDKLPTLFEKPTCLINMDVLATKYPHCKMSQQELDDFTFAKINPKLLEDHMLDQFKEVLKGSLSVQDWIDLKLSNFLIRQCCDELKTALKNPTEALIMITIDLFIKSPNVAEIYLNSYGLRHRDFHLEMYLKLVKLDASQTSLVKLYHYQMANV